MSRTTNRLATTLYVTGLNCTTPQSRLVGSSRRRIQSNPDNSQILKELLEKFVPLKKIKIT